VKSVQFTGKFIEEFVAGLEKTLADYPEGTEKEVVHGGAEGLHWLVKLAEATLSDAGMSDLQQAQLFSRIQALHAALLSPHHSQYVDVTRAINKSWSNFKETLQHAYMAIGLELRMEGWPSESEKTAAKAIANAFRVLDRDGVPDAAKVIGWRTTAKRKSPTKYPLLRDQFSKELRGLKDAYPDQPKRQYEAWRNFVAAKWKAKI
jgi:hypothetical protein